MSLLGNPRFVDLLRLIGRRARLLLVLTVVLALAYDMKTSRIQADVLSWLNGRMTFAVAEGANPDLRFPEAGPYDRRLGYSRLPGFIGRLPERDYRISRQARLSEQLDGLVQLGGFPPYREKSQAGLEIVDRQGRELFHDRYPGRVFADYGSIPPLIVRSLLFIENRELLDPSFPTRNPAVEWDRLAAAIAGRFRRLQGGSGGNGRDSGGGSTLATQIEKFRHSPDGRTVNAFEKLRQMASASVRAYRDGPDTTAARRDIVLAYLNTTPLGGRPGFGEVNGLGDGLWAWYGAELETVTRLLGDPGGDPQARALAFKQVLSLLLAQRRPATYLNEEPKALDLLSDSHLRVLAAEGLIAPDLARAALLRVLALQPDVPAPAPVSFVARKAANAIRAKLMTELGLASPYELDRLDLRVETTLDADVQEQVVSQLQLFADPEKIAELGLKGRRLLDRGDPGEVVYSLTLFERGEGANHLRLQADTLDQPFDLNRGAKLDLGSTAKLRTLVLYLQIVAQLHRRLAGLERHAIDAFARDAGDPLTRWTARQIGRAKDKSLSALLAAALARRYSASPVERFYTGGGVHRFANFRAADNGRAPTVAEALRDSINLPFIRLMRDIVHYYMAQLDGPGTSMLAERDHPGRQIYLELFADLDGSLILRKFLKSYGGKAPDESLARLVEQLRPGKDRLAVVFRSTRPDDSLGRFRDFMATHHGGEALDEERLAKLFEEYAPGRFSLTDRAYIAGVHPLELWLVTFLQDHPAASRNDVLAASTIERQAAHGWLFRTKHKSAQNLRIRQVLEREAFLPIHRAWQRLGYPFGSLVPSYATAIGSSADRPSALAELMGIILNDGLRLPMVEIERLRFAEGTPYETEFSARRHGGQRVMAAEVAAALRQALVDVVQEGTARRAKGAFATIEEMPVAVGGKTGTGDNRHKRFGPGGRLISSTAVNRTATFAFFIGERFFGSITAFVDGPQADGYGFTSSLPVQVLKVLAPILQPLLEQAPRHTAEAAAAE